MTADSTLHARERISQAYSEEDELRWTWWLFFPSSFFSFFFFIWKGCDEISLERTSSDRNEYNPLPATEMTQGCFFSGTQATGDEHIAFCMTRLTGLLRRDSLNFLFSIHSCPVSPLSASSQTLPERYCLWCFCIISCERLSGTWGGEGDEMLSYKMDCPINELNWLIELHVIKAAKWISFPSHFSLRVFCLGNTTKYNLPVLERGWHTLACRFVHEKNIVLASVTNATRQ